MQDIIPHGDRSIRRIPINKNSGKRTFEENEVRFEHVPVEDLEERNHKHHKLRHTEHLVEKDDYIAEINNAKKREVENQYDFSEYDDTDDGGDKKHFLFGPLLWALIVLAIIVGIGAYGFFYSYAEVTVTPKTQVVSVTDINANASSLAGFDAMYTLISESATGTISVPAQGSENISSRAEGVLTVYNNYSPVSQKLVKNTRFSTSKGKIFRLNDTVIVPGTTKKNGKTYPGVIDVKVTADAPGQDYNVAPTQFTLPGFRGDPRFNAITAENKRALSGGFVGNRKKISEADASLALTKLTSDLEDKLRKSLMTHSDANRIISTSSFIYDVGIPQRDNSLDNKVDIKLSVTAKAYAFDPDELVKIISSDSSLAAEKNALYVKDWSGIGIKVNPIKSKDATSTVAINVNGKVKIYWYFNEEKLKEDLSGTSKSPENMTNVLKNYTGIYSAEALIRPFWKTSFPVDPLKIHIITKE